MPEDRKPLVPPGPTEDVYITFPDGRKLPIRYTIGSYTRLKAKLGVSLIGRNGALSTLGEDTIPALILEGLKTAAPAGLESDITEDYIRELPASYMPYLLRSFMASFQDSLPDPEKNEVPDAPATALM